jgi:hypothetical protein
VILINSVLNGIPIFYLSFMKMLVEVWKRIVRLQRRFLWDGSKQLAKSYVLRWSEVCKPKSRGGLGVRVLCLVNMVLLGKWKWRLISRGQALLRDILIARLRIRSILFHLGGRLGGLRNVSLGGCLVARFWFVFDRPLVPIWCGQGGSEWPVNLFLG